MFNHLTVKVFAADLHSCMFQLLISTVSFLSNTHEVNNKSKLCKDDIDIFSCLTLCFRFLAFNLKTEGAEIHSLGEKKTV